MYVSQIDNIIDQILNKLYLEGLSKDPTFKVIVNSKKLNYVEFREQINSFIQQFMKTINIEEIQKLINNRENLIRILDIIKRYVAYYYFLSIAYYYTGTIKDFRNNLIQYSKLQENSTFVIKNFFDTENNYQVIYFFKIIKDVSKILLMTDLQKKTLNPLDVKDAIKFLNNLGRDFIDNYLLTLVKKGNEQLVEINVHNLIKTVVFREIYRNQEQKMVFEILNDIEESEYESTYIDIVVSADEAVDFESFRQIFLGDDDTETIAHDMYELAIEATRITPVLTAEYKNNNLIRYKNIVPIVDDFLRYHKDSESLDEGEKTLSIPPISVNNARNVQLAILYQQRKKKENTKVQIVINKIDAISSYYSENVKNNQNLQKDIKAYFQGPLSYRKAVLHNYLDEIKIITKMLNQGRKVIEGNEYFLELVSDTSHAYFNFKDFQKYGTTLGLTNSFPINMLRYSNIEYQTQMAKYEIDIHTNINDSTINLVGLAIPLVQNLPYQCIRKENMVDIRAIKLNYLKDGELISNSSDNGYKAFLNLIRHFYINTIKFSNKNEYSVYHDFSETRKLNSAIYNKMVYWEFDINKDQYEMTTYENIKTYNFQETIRYMNAKIYDKIVGYFHKRLAQLISDHITDRAFDISLLIEYYSVIYRLFLKQNEKIEIFIQEYLRKKPFEETKIAIIKEKDRIGMPGFTLIAGILPFKISIDMINPLNVQEYIKLEAYSRKTPRSDTLISKTETKCKHENEWNQIQKLINVNLNRFNIEMTQFIEKFAIETTEMDFVCNVCGQILPLKKYVQDGTFNNATERFITAYTPLDVPLEDVKEYIKYRLTIRYLDGLVNRVSLITNTNMLVGQTLPVKQKRKAIIKNIVDLIIKHNAVNLRKNQSDEERLDFFSKKFNIDKDFDSIFFFELSDTIFNFEPTESSVSTDLNRLKFNNILLYFMLVFIVELNGVQITLMSRDKIANIYTYLKYGSKLFGDLLIKKNVNDTETISINKYPVLCYLIFVISFFLVKYKLWYYPGASTKVFNPVIQKIIINSFVDLINSISLDGGNMPNDYIYLLTTSKFYSQLNTTFRNNSVINVLKRTQIQYSDTGGIDKVPVVSEIIPTYSIEHPIKVNRPIFKIRSFKLTSGLVFDRRDELVYQYLDYNSDITNCPFGSYHVWVEQDSRCKLCTKEDIYCRICEEIGKDDTGSRDRSEETYYYNLGKIADRRCISGILHDFVGKEGQFVCNNCKRKKGDKYTKEELTQLSKNLDKIEDDNARANLDDIAHQGEIMEKERDHVRKILKQLEQNYKQESDNKIYGQISILSNKLIKILEDLIGVDTNLDIDKYPTYINDDVYIIDHSYDGATFPEPVIFTQKENRVLFKENHSFFKRDVYSYIDHKTQIEVFYSAITLKLIGYKEKYKEYVINDKLNNYLKISSSIKNQLLNISYESKYIDISDAFMKNSKIIKDTNQNFFQILDNLIKSHILKIKAIIDKIDSILYSVKNYRYEEETDINFLKSSQILDKIVAKFSKEINNFQLGKNNDAFGDWNYIRNSFGYKKINWEETNVRMTENMFINTDLINFYDSSSNLMIYYVVNELIDILDSNPERISKVSICQLYIELIFYIYHLYNTDSFKDSPELKRFGYILNSSPMMIDILKKGQGLSKSKELEEGLDEATIDDLDRTEDADELEEIREEADSIDLRDYWEDDLDQMEEDQGDA